MAKKPRLKTPRPLSLEEKLGHWWGVVFIAMVVILVVTLFGKGCFFPD